VDQEILVDGQMTKFLALIERQYVSSRAGLRPLDLSNAMQQLSQDIISATELGEPFGYLDADKDIYGILFTFEAILKFVMVMTLFPTTAVKLVSSPLMRRFLPKPTNPTGLGRLMGLVKEHVDSRYGDGKKRPNDAHQKFVESGLSREDVESHAFSHLVGAPTPQA